MILIVEDHRELGRGLLLLLRDAGYGAALAASGEEALRLVAELRPRLILLDQNMPGLSGIDVLRRLRTDPDAELERIPVIMNTASPDPAIEAEARRLGICAYLEKGSDEWDDLVSLVEQCDAESAGAPHHAAHHARRT